MASSLFYVTLLSCFYHFVSISEFAMGPSYLERTQQSSHVRQVDRAWITERLGELCFKERARALSGRQHKRLRVSNDMDLSLSENVAATVCLLLDTTYRERITV